jgi:uncharacterized membrane protein YkvA (DUF1232 family)
MKAEMEKSNTPDGKSTSKPLWKRLKKSSRELKNQIYTLYYASRDERTPWYAKALTVLVVAYALSPIDLIPDFIPVLGYLDDLIIVPGGIALVLRLIPQEVMVEAREKAGQVTAMDRLPRWIGTGITIMIWLLGLGVIAWLVLELIKFIHPS